LLTSARQKEQKFFASFFQKRRIWRVFGSAAGPDVASYEPALLTPTKF
jgi:hypothetical protein